MTISKYRKLIFITILAFIIGVVLLIMADNLIITSYDYWWHVKTGEWIVENRQIPTNDIFSWYGIENNLTWTSHEWLSALTIFGMTKLFGINYGGFLFCLICVFVLFMCLFLFNRRKYENNPLFAFIWLCCGVLIFSSFINPRPFLISYMLFACTIYVCEQLRKNENSKKIYLLPIISLLWTNFHGGSSNLVYIIPLCYLIPNLFNIKMDRLKTNPLTKKQIKKYVINILVSILALAINPHGLYMIIYPYANMLDSTMQAYISEWRAIDLKIELSFGLFIFGIFFIGMFTKKDLEVTDCILLFFFVLLSFRSIRFISMLYIVASFLVFKYVKVMHLKETNVMYFLARNLPLILLLSSGVFIFIFSNMIIVNYDKVKIEKLVSDDVISQIKEKGYDRIFNTYGIGGYLIYNDINVFIDGRADVYSGNIFKSTMELITAETNIKEGLAEYNFDGFIIGKDTKIYNYFESVDDYKLIAEDEQVGLYEKK